jgi:hypothetical protein
VIALDATALAAVRGGERTWGRVAADYAGACANGALTSLQFAPPTPYTLGVGCGAGMVGQAAVDGINYLRRK